MPRFLTVGHVLKTSGKKGAVVFKPIEEIEATKLIGRKLFIAPPLLEMAFVNVEQALVKDKRLLLFFKEINSIDLAEKLVGKVLQISEGEYLQLAKPLEKDYRGYKCVTDKGTFVGYVKEIIKNPAHDIFVVEGKKGEILIPNVPAFISKIKDEEKEVVLKEQEFQNNWGQDA